MSHDEDDNDSPFAHVPSPSAGPGPLQDGPFTYEKLVASTGRGSLHVGTTWRRILGFAAIGIVVFIVVAGVLAMLLR